MAKTSKNLLLSAAKIANRKLGKGFKMKLQMVGNRFIYVDFEHKLEIGLNQTLTREIVYDSVAELELYTPQDERTATILRQGREFIAKELCKAFAWANMATDMQSTRYSLGGVCWDDRFLVATCGRRLHLIEVGPCQVAENPSQKSNIIPSRAVNAIVSLIKLFRDDVINVEMGSTYVMFCGDVWRFTARLVEGRFPDWRFLVNEQNFENNLTLQTENIRNDAQFSIHRTRLEDTIAKKSMSRKELKNYGGQIPVCKIGDHRLNAEYVIEALTLIDNACFVAYHSAINGPLLIGDKMSVNEESGSLGRALAVIMPVSQN